MSHSSVRLCVSRASQAALLALAASIADPTVLAQQAAASAPLTLDAALTRALQANRTITVARLSQPVAAAASGVARERPNPDLTFEVERETPKQSVTFSLPIELGGKRDRRVGLAAAGVASAEAEIARVVADVQNDVRRGYFQLVAAERGVQLAVDARALWVRVHDAAAARFAGGLAPQQEERQAQLNLLEADQDLTSARGEAVAARAELNVLLGDPVDAPLVLADGLTSRPLPTLPDVLGQARQANAALTALDRQIDAQRARRDLARALRRSDLTLGAAFTYLAMPEFHVGYRASVGITLPLFTKHIAGVVLEDAELTRLSTEREAATADITAAVTAAFARATAARERIIEYETEIVPLISQIEQMAQDGYTAGQRDLVNLITALQGNKESRQRGLQAGLDYQLALADLERAMGTRLR